MGFEYKTKTTIYGWPIVHVAFGRDDKGRVMVAKGILAIGQFGIGVITLAQLGVGVLFGFGQLIGGLVAIGQVAPAVFFGIGQLTTGHVAIGQLGIGDWVMAQFGLGVHLWTTTHTDPEAVAYFRALGEQVTKIIGIIF